MMTGDIIRTIQIKFGKDLSIYSASFLQNILTHRMKETESVDLEGYLDFLVREEDELLKLTDSLQITYTFFFRNTIDMSFLEGFVLPNLLQFKEKSKSQSVRIWSVGCSDGSEAYSLAMLTDKVISDRDYHIPVMVFGTDISTSALGKACQGIYDHHALQNVKLSYIYRYFTLKKSQYTVNEKIRDQVDFSSGNIIDATFTSPPAGIFADFDLISCCNLLIYYNHEIQQLILEKLFHSLAKHGYLMVGESERSIVEKFGKFRLLYPMGNIFINHKS